MTSLLLFISLLLNGSVIYYSAPPLPIKEPVVAPVVKTMIASVSAYTSHPSETDSTPNITASGSKTRQGVAANNCIAFGTKIEIEGIPYTIEDRMNKRFGCNHVDVWFKDRSEALKWGVRKLTVKIY